MSLPTLSGNHTSCIANASLHVLPTRHFMYCQSFTSCIAKASLHVLPKRLAITFMYCQSVSQKQSSSKRRPPTPSALHTLHHTTTLHTSPQTPTPNMHTRTLTRTHMHTLTYTHAYTHMHTCINTHMRTHVHTYTHTHIHTCTHAYTHIHTYIGLA